tara:strand:+ start:315 stop:539 length:225 start_codon:yes stop_codon:yes gene_type:complete
MNQIKVKDIVVLIMTVGLFLLLTIIVVGDFYVSLKENKPVDEGVITLLKMSISGIVGIVAGYMSRNKCFCKEED